MPPPGLDNDLIWDSESDARSSSAEAVGDIFQFLDQFKDCGSDEISPSTLQHPRGYLRDASFYRHVRTRRRRLRRVQGVPRRFGDVTEVADDVVFMTSANYSTTAGRTQDSRVEVTDTEVVGTNRGIWAGMKEAMMKLMRLST